MQPATSEEERPTWLPLHLSGEMATLTRAHDWSSTAVGDPARWPVALKTAVTMLLECKLPMYLAWGDELIQFYNDAYRPILGNKHPAALGRSATLSWPEIWETISPMWQEVLQGKSFGFDDFKLTIDRYGYPEDCYFNFSYSPVRDESTRPRGVLVAFAETTQRVLAEQRLRFLDELAQGTRARSDPADVMQFTAEMLGRYLEANRCAYAQVHDDEDTFDLIGDYNDGVHSIIGRYRFTDFGSEVTRLLREGKPYVNRDVDTDPVTAGQDLSAYRATKIQSVICVPLRKDGRFVAAMALHQATPRRWSDDEVTLVATVVDRCWDVLQRLRAQAEMQEEARSLELLNQTGAALSAELQLDALLQRVTDAATQLTGARFGAFFYNGVDERGEALMLYTLSGAPREAFERFGHPRPTALFAPTFRGDDPIRIDDVLVDPRYGLWGPHHGMPAGHLPVRSYLAVPVISRSGSVIGGLFFGHPDPAIFSERSERLALGIAGQAAIAVDNARLYAQAQQSATDRAALLESERAARVEAERANAVKDTFLATLSHELRTPLSAISGWVHILKRRLGADRADLLRGVEVIERSTHMQVQLIDDLLDMSRITSGKLSLEKRPVSPVEFVDAALDIMAPAAEAAGVALTSRIEPCGPILGDAGRLQQVVWNLMSNAVKFTPRDGKILLELEESGQEVLIRVTDTGVGIEGEVLPHVFERFRQADSSMSRHFGGLGLGLSIVRNLVELHGGTVSAQSDGQGRGATFTVRLPLLLTHLDGRVPPLLAPAASKGEEIYPALEKARVLVVDDDPNARELLQRVLEEAGSTVTTASNVDDALSRFRQNLPDIVVSDIGMPGEDGYSFIQRLRRLPNDAGAQVPAIALTAFARREDRERALQAGFTAHVTKPIDPAALLATMERLLHV